MSQNWQTKLKRALRNTRVPAPIYRSPPRTTTNFPSPLFCCKFDLVSRAFIWSFPLTFTGPKHNVSPKALSSSELMLLHSVGRSVYGVAKVYCIIIILLLDTFTQCLVVNKTVSLFGIIRRVVYSLLRFLVFWRFGYILWCSSEKQKHMTYHDYKLCFLLLVASTFLFAQ